ncbi:branched-chain amino acid ABC transporter permease [Microbacterium sp. zg.Y1090]|uniref:branched-chain amino acid ABC transporter permease n=1 Tax=Microbacterium wangruii TaxID=3049073 RepID=UPI00214DDC87|nr:MULTISPECIES: branched-chain amino acid ABC transporter permease [unclassified Microbacterium]MCR2819482.1 branched-chain amino acid ABC transporter permease [Microbacterium sp. zg.Y1090]WIM28455.1 branched-chain amino acid ABC transporter permease [Microbacterium sp. zg-Y1090]
MNVPTRPRLLPGLTGTPRVLVLAVLLTVLAIGATFLLDPFRNFQLATAAAYLCAVAGLTLLIGLSGQLSLGHAALMIAGGYGYALTSNALTDAGIDGVPRFVASLAAGVLTATLLGLLLGLAAARLRGPYLAGLTLALVVAVPAITSVWSGVFRGDQGLQTAYNPVPPALERLIALEQWQAWVAIIVASVVVTALALLRRGPLGLRMRAVRDDETAARLNGVPARRVKVTAFTVSAAGAGAGGAVLCFVTQSVGPGAYTLAFSLLLVVAAVVGGLGSLGGAALGSAVIVVLPWALNAGTAALDLPADLSQRLAGNLSLLVFGALLIAVMLLRPTGLAGLATSWRRRGTGSGRRPAAGGSGPAAAVAGAGPAAAGTGAASAAPAPAPAPAGTGAALSDADATPDVARSAATEPTDAAAHPRPAGTPASTDPSRTIPIER